MELTLFKALIDEFYELNRIPVFVMQKTKIVYNTIAKDNLANCAEEFLNRFIDNEITVFGDIEFYTSFKYSDNRIVYKVIVGPVFSAHPMTIGYKGKLALENLINKQYYKDFMLSITLTGEDSFIKYVSVILKMVGKGKFNYKELIRKNISLESTLDKSLTEYVFDTRENLLSPYAPETEKRILEMVKEGDIEGVKKINMTLTVDAPGQSVSYLFKIVSLVAICTRAVLDCDVDATLAYGLSDKYLEKLGAAVNNKQISDIASNVLPHFAKLVVENKGEKLSKYSPHLVKAEKYIKAHTHYNISLADVAKEVGVSEKYLSRIFITHKGEKFTQYVNRCRVNEAKELILNTNHSLTEIAYSLGFVSESYFIKIFGELCGMTPNTYRKKYKNNK